MFDRFHAETSILTTIYSLLFWDIIFAPIPGAFETSFQTAPLDIGEDSFYAMRQDLIDDRLNDIKAGNAKEYLQMHDRQYRDSNTWCIGVKWDMCEPSDLVEIVEVSGQTVCL